MYSFLVAVGHVFVCTILAQEPRLGIVTLWQPLALVKSIYPAMQSPPVFAAALDSKALRALGSAPGVATSAMNLDSMSDCGMDLDAPDPKITPDEDAQNATYTVAERSRLSDFGVEVFEMKTPSGLKGASIPPPSEESMLMTGMPAAPKRFK